jgi:hypothetical protein
VGQQKGDLGLSMTSGCHERAKRQYLAEKEAQKDRNHLLSNLPKLARAIQVILQYAEGSDPRQLGVVALCP